jgi:D-alanyl-D-alanine carboxypeptidase
LKTNANAAFNKMAAAMKKDLGFTLSFTTAYRSWAQQENSLNNHTYNTNPSVMKNRFKSVAPKGYSEHHTGYACDITINGNGSRNNFDWLSNNMLKKAYEWLREHAKEYGFEQSFPKNNKQGVIEEAWHWRYVGDADAKKVFYEARKYAGYTDLE